MPHLFSSFPNPLFTSQKQDTRTQLLIKRGGSRDTQATKDTQASPTGNPAAPFDYSQFMKGPGAGAGAGGAGFPGAGSFDPSKMVPPIPSYPNPSDILDKVSAKPPAAGAGAGAGGSAPFDYSQFMKGPGAGAAKAGPAAPAVSVSPAAAASVAPAAASSSSSGVVPVVLALALGLMAGGFAGFHLKGRSGGYEALSQA